MKFKHLLLVILCLQSVGCSKRSTRPEYCDGIQASSTSYINALHDYDVAWIGTALTQVGYQGNCPCPDSVDKNGNLCGMRSAYSKPGGRKLLCSPDDVSRNEISEIREVAIRLSLPKQCGGADMSFILEYGATPNEKVPNEWNQ